MINLFQTENDQLNKGLLIHLNASDDRGIDIVRNQINSFVNSKSIFSKGIKFIILDEVDYMTKNAQFALKYLLQEYNVDVRFCLICNYISKIDESLQNELVRLRFNQLPKEDIINFLNIINKNEDLNLTNKHLESIQITYKSDIRSMINCMQSNQLAIKDTKVIDNTIYDDITTIITTKTINIFSTELYNMSFVYNSDIKNIIKNYFNYIIKYKPIYLSSQLLDFFELIIHNQDLNIEYQIKFMFYSLSILLS